MHVKGVYFKDKPSGSKDSCGEAKLQMGHSISYGCTDGCASSA